MTADPIIVYAEDDEGFRHTFETLMERSGYKVRVFENGKKALEEIKKLHDRDVPTILITDWQMPVMNGLELLKSLQVEKIKLPTVVLSGDKNLEKELDDAGLSVGNIIKKPAGRDDIEKAIGIAVLGYTPLTGKTPMDHATRLKSGRVK